MHKFNVLKFFSVAAVSCMLALPVYAGGIQMLPPVSEVSKNSGAPLPCPSSAVSNLLTWDGQSPITCVTGVSAAGGNVVATGSITPGPFAVGSACAPEGAMGYDPTAHAPVYCSKTSVWAQLSPVIETKTISCPLQFIGGGNDSWGCTATCPDGWKVTGGGFSAPGVAQFMNGHYSMPDGNNGWISNVGVILSCTSGSPSYGCDGNPTSWAVCTRVKPGN